MQGLPPLPPTLRPFADYWDRGGSPYRTGENGLGLADSGNVIQNYNCVDCGCFFCNCDVDTTVYKMKVPIGLESRSQVAYGANRDVCEKFNPNSYRNELKYREYPFNDPLYLFNNETVNGYPRKLTDEVATLCAGGSKLGPNNYLHTDTVRANEAKHIILDTFHITGASTECSLFFNDANKSNDTGLCQDSCHPGKCCNDGFYQVRVDWPTYCQMGDYIDTINECKDRCRDAEKPNINNPNYCHFAKDRICSKQKVPYHDDSNESLKYVNILKRGEGTQQVNKSVILSFKDRVLAFYP